MEIRYLNINYLSFPHLKLLLISNTCTKLLSIISYNYWVVLPIPHTACECNGHADDCIAGSGCINCTDNTMGNDCSLCVPGYYANSSLLPIDTKYCTGNSSNVEIISDILIVCLFVFLF